MLLRITSYTDYHVRIDVGEIDDFIYDFFVCLFIWFLFGGGGGIKELFLEQKYSMHRLEIDFCLITY